MQYIELLMEQKVQNKAVVQDSSTESHLTFACIFRANKDTR